MPKRAAVSPELLAPLETFRLIIRHPSRFGFTYLVRIRALAMGPGIRSNYLKFLFGATVCVFVWISNFRSLHQWYMRCCVVFSVHFSFFSGVILHDTLFSCSSLFVVTLLLLLLFFFRVTFTQSLCITHIAMCSLHTCPLAIPKYMHFIESNASWCLLILCMTNTWERYDCTCLLYNK